MHPQIMKASMVWHLVMPRREHAGSIARVISDQSGSVGSFRVELFVNMTMSSAADDDIRPPHK